MLFKIVCGTEIHVLNSSELLSYHSLLKFIHAKFKQLPSQYSLTYRDPEDDRICLSSDNDMEVLQYLNLKKVKI